MLKVVKFSITYMYLYLDIFECCVSISHDLGEQLQHISYWEQQRLLLQRERERDGAITIKIIQSSKTYSKL
jgi:hypothetical protein